jgi:3',5'-cyclic AMP phosphodiesterase CpdA
VIQLTDPHIVAPPWLLSGQVDSAERLRQVVAQINADLPKIAPVDAVLVTGDISDEGSPESYAEFRRLMAPLDLPLFVIPGNHDQREPMREAFADCSPMPGSGRLNWTAQVQGLHLVGLDTLVEGQGGGILDEYTLDFLATALASAGKAPVLIALHHPPFASGIKFMDRIGLDGTEALSEVLRHAKGEVRLVCGHLHAMMAGTVGQAVALSCPATCSTFAADFRDEAPVGFFTAPGGYMVHDWNGGFRSIQIGMDRGDGPFPFR